MAHKGKTARRRRDRRSVADSASSSQRRERWYDIAEYLGVYQISTFGRVRALARIDALGNRRSMRVLRQKLRPNGRVYFNLCKRGVATSHCVSVLLAAAYGIANPRRCSYVIHLNHENRDFRRCNLAWATLAEQRMHDGHKVNCRYYGVTCDSKHTGVLKWVASIRLNYRRQDFGSFASPEEAAYAYDRGVRHLGLDRPLNGVRRPKAFRPVVRSLPGETWRGFPHSPLTHQISNKGRVRTLSHVTAHGHRVLPRLRKVTIDANGCRSVVIHGRRYGIASATALAFPGVANVGTPGRRLRGARRLPHRTSQ